MHHHFGDLKGVETDIDDINLVHADTEIKHDTRLHAVIDRCQINLILNKEKCVFKVKEVTYIGHKLTQELKESSAMMRKFVPLMTRRHPSIRKE